MSRYPLAYDLHGDPLDVPAEAVAWRVRRASGRPGRPQNVYDPETGRQLEIPLESTVDDLRDHGCGPGRYRLEAVDREGKAIVGVVAFTEVVNGEDPDSSVAPGRTPFALVLEKLMHAVDTNSRVMEAMAQAFGPVRPVQGAPVVVADATDESMKPEQIAQTVASVAKSVADVWKGTGGNGA